MSFFIRPRAFMAWLMWWERVVFSESARFSTPKNFSALAMPEAVRDTVRDFSSTK